MIDRVIEYDSESIKCETDSHQSTNNPLADNGGLSTVILVEYASQAAAIHAALNKQEFTQGKPAFIGSIRNIELFTASLKEIRETLVLEAKCVLSNPNGAIYEFSVSHHKLIARGQINLVLPA